MESIWDASSRLTRILLSGATETRCWGFLRLGLNPVCSRFDDFKESLSNLMKSCADISIPQLQIGLLGSKALLHSTKPSLLPQPCSLARAVFEGCSETQTEPHTQ